MLIKKELPSAKAMELINSANDFNNGCSIDDLDCILMGQYPQQDKTGKIREPIEWVVLEKNEDEHEALLFSKYILDFNNVLGEKNVTWENSKLRKWLDEDFKKNTFSDDEIDKICRHELKTKGNSYAHVSTTKDQIFCLSQEEIETIFHKSNGYYNVLARADITDYAMNVFKKYAGVEEEKDYFKNYEYSYFLLRNLSIDNKDTYSPMYINPSGGIVDKSQYLTPMRCGIRPAMWIRY